MNKHIFFTFIYTFLVINVVSAQYGIPISGPVNDSRYVETAPHISFDGKRMIYMSVQSDTMRMFEAELVNGQWGNPQPIEVINTLIDSGAVVNAPVYNYDAGMVYFEADFNKAISGTDIFYIKRLQKGWSAPKTLGTPVNTKDYDGEPSISPDNLTLYFTRLNPNPDYKDFNCKKIFYAKLNPDGSWSDPVALPSPINLYCECTPRIQLDNKTLYMASVREESRGGFDIFFAKKLSEKVWMIPVPIDTLNTVDNESFASMSAETKQFYIFRSNDKRKIEGKGIYQQGMVSQNMPDGLITFTGKITEQNTGNALDAHIRVLDPISNRAVYEFTTDTKGNYFYTLPPGKSYILDYTASGFSHTFLPVNPSEFKANKKYPTDISLFNNITLLLNVFDQDMFEPLDVNIEVYSGDKAKPISVNSKVITKGRYMLQLPIGSHFTIKISNDIYATSVLEFDLSGVVQFEEFERDVELVSQKQKIDFLISEALGQKGVPVEIEIVNLSTNEKYRTTVTTDENGNASTYLRKGDKYSVNISPKGYTFYSTQLDLDADNIKPNEKIVVQAVLTELKQEAKFELKNITFETNSAELNASSFDELNRVVKLLKDNPNIRVEIGAHSDDVGSDTYNLKLSVKRAESVVNYLIEKEVEYNRLTFKGYGETVPLLPNNSEQNRAINRRVEIQIK